MKNKKLEEINNKIKAIDKDLPYDRRKKEYIEGTKQIKQLTKEAKKIILTESIKQLEEQGHVFIDENKLYCDAPVATLKYGDGFTLYLKPEFYTGNYVRDAYDAKYHIYDRLGRYVKSLVDSESKDDKNNINNIIKTAFDKYTESKRVENVNNKNSNEFYLAVKDDVTYKDYDWRVEEKPDKEWTGSKVESEFIGNDSDRLSGDKSRLEVEFYREKIDIHADLRITFKTNKEAIEFWNKYTELVKGLPNFKKNTRRY